MDVNLRFNWRRDSSTGKAVVPGFRLGANETCRIDVAALQATNTIPKEANWASVFLTTNGLPDEVVAVATSYDETLRYGAQTPFSDQLAFHWAGSRWDYDVQHNSFITAGNGGVKPLQAAFTIYYNQGTQRFELEQTLQPDEQMWIDVGKLIRERVLDKNGNTLPADLTSGSYEIRDLTNKGVGNLYEGKIIYDKTYGHVTYGCPYRASLRARRAKSATVRHLRRSRCSRVADSPLRSQLHPSQLHSWRLTAPANVSLRLSVWARVNVTPGTTAVFRPLTRESSTMPDCELVLRCVKLDSSENFEGLHGEFCRMRKTSAIVHCSGALSHGRPAARRVKADKKSTKKARRMNMTGTQPILTPLVAVPWKRVVKSSTL